MEMNVWNQIELSRKIKVGRSPPGEDELEALRDQGVRAIIDLRTDTERFAAAATPAAEETNARARGLDYIRVPISTQHVNRQDLDRVGEALLNAPKPVLIHCASGKRAGMVALVHTAIETGVPGDEMLEMARHLDLVFGDPAQQQEFAHYVDQRETHPDPLRRREEALRVDGRPIPLLPEATRVLTEEMDEDHHRELALDHKRDDQIDPIGVRPPVAPRPRLGRRVKIMPAPVDASVGPTGPHAAPATAWTPPVALATAAGVAGVILLVLDRRLLVPLLLVAGVMAARAVATLRATPPQPPAPVDPQLDRDIADLERRMRRLSKTA